jgi:hypothetical protein
MIDEKLISKLKEYLSLGSCDGRIERQPLRKELCELLGEEYDEKNHSIKKRGLNK